MKVHPAGRLIVMGLPGPELTDGLRDLIRRVQPGGFIFFTRNMAEAGQFHGLVKECAELVAHPTIMTVDQEGGPGGEAGGDGGEAGVGRGVSEGRKRGVVL